MCIRDRYTSGLVTAGERYNKVVDIWGRTTEKVGKVMMDEISNEPVIDRHGNKTTQESFNSIYMLSLIHILLKINGLKSSRAISFGRPH